MLTEAILLGIFFTVFIYTWNTYLKHYFGTENRHRMFANYYQDFPAFHNVKALKQKRELFDALRKMGRYNRVLEIGPGSGANLGFFGDFTILTAVDPNPFFKPYLERNLRKYPHIKLDKYVVSGAEDMSAIRDQSIDAVVSTLVLCSIKDTKKVYEEIRRVLVPGGKFFFMEHVREENWNWRAIMQIVGSNLGIYQFFFDGCRNDKDLGGDIIKHGGFETIHTKQFRLEVNDGIPWSYLPVHLVVPHVYGIATTKEE